MSDISKHSGKVLDDEEIDFSDIPETTPEMWENARLRVPSSAASVPTPLSDRLISEDGYSALGRLLGSFNCLEHELMRAVIDLRGGFENSPAKSDEERQIEKEIGYAFKKRLDTFLATYRAEIGADQWITDFEAKISDAVIYRNHFLHGVWTQKENGWMHCSFFKRAKNGEKPEEKIWFGTCGALREIAEINFCNAELLARHFSANDQAAE